MEQFIYKDIWKEKRAEVIVKTLFTFIYRSPTIQVDFSIRCSQNCLRCPDILLETNK